MKSDRKKSVANNDTESDILSAYLAEYEAMRAELLQVQGAQGQLVLYSLLFIGVSIPIVATLLQNQLWVSLLVLPMLFSSTAWAYIGYVGMSYRISIYINSHLRPAINDLLKQGPSQNIFAWEKFARSKGLNVLALPKGFEILLFILPSIGSVVLFFYIKNTLNLGLTTAEWIVFAIDCFLTIGAIIMAVVVTRLGYSRLAEESKA